MAFWDIIKKTLLNKRGYKYRYRYGEPCYETEFEDNRFKLYHYGTKILEFDTQENIVTYIGGYSLSDFQAIEEALSAIRSTLDVNTGYVERLDGDLCYIPPRWHWRDILKFEESMVMVSGGKWESERERREAEDERRRENARWNARARIRSAINAIKDGKIIGEKKEDGVNKVIRLKSKDSRYYLESIQFVKDSEGLAQNVESFRIPASMAYEIARSTDFSFERYDKLKKYFLYAKAYKHYNTETFVKVNPFFEIRCINNTMEGRGALNFSKEVEDKKEYMFFVKYFSDVIDEREFCWHKTYGELAEEKITVTIDTLKVANVFRDIGYNEYAKKYLILTITKAHIPSQRITMENLGRPSIFLKDLADSYIKPIIMRGLVA